MYSGSGAVAIEAVSRGMDRAFLFENNRLAQKTIEQNIEITKSPRTISFKTTKCETRTQNDCK